MIIQTKHSDFAIEVILHMRLFSVLLVIMFQSCSPNSETIKIKGSDTEVNLVVVLAEQIRKENDVVLVSVSGGG
jgi:phosphate transport system substrate-binding protein